MAIKNLMQKLQLLYFRFMGVTNQFEVVNAQLRQQLGYHLDPTSSDSFRSLLRLAGIRRVQHAIQLIKLRGLPAEQRHKALVSQVWALMPPKTSKYRNPQVQAMKLDQRR